MIDATKFPQLTRMQEVQGSSQQIGESLEWLSENGMFVGKHIVPEGWTTEVFVPIIESTEQLLARHFDIDLKAVERERRAILDECRTELGRAA